LTIGWHFFREGLEHASNPNWTSDGFFRGAQGPLAPFYHALIPDYEFHHWDAYLLSPRPDTLVAAVDQKADAAPAKAEKPYQEWLTEVKHDWDALLERLSPRLNADQKEKAKKIVAARQAQLAEFLADYEGDIRTYRHEMYRLQQLRSAPGALDVPYERARIVSRSANPTGERGVTIVIDSSPAVWQSGARAIEQDLKSDLSNLLDPKDSSAVVSAEEPVWWETWMQQGAFYFGKYGVLAVGVLLILGLFTGLASWAGALFLLSVIMTQPPWLPQTIPTYNFAVEAVALLALAGTAAGRWCGLDFFLYRMFGGARY
jgi:hypothetical protein